MTTCTPPPRLATKNSGISGRSGRSGRIVRTLQSLAVTGCGRSGRIFPHALRANTHAPLHTRTLNPSTSHLAHMAWCVRCVRCVRSQAQQGCAASADASASVPQASARARAPFFIYFH